MALKLYPKFASILFISLFFTTVIEGQNNIVPDHSLEAWDGVNVFALSGSPFWYPASGTPDLHRTNFPNTNLSGLSPCPQGQGNTNCGYPQDGDAVLGCWKENGATGTREWGAVQLVSPMTEGNCYTVSFWVQNKEDNPDNLYETNQWGLYFSETSSPPWSPSLANFSNKLQHIVMAEEVINDTIWHYIEYDYQAAGDYEYIYIGYMGDVSTSTYTSASDVGSIGFYAWFDNISVIDVTPDLLVSADSSICVGDSILITANSNYPIQWTHLPPNDTTSSFWASPDQTRTYYVATIDGTACTKIDSVTISILQENSFDFASPLCVASTPVELDPSVNGNGTWQGDGIIDATTGLFDPSLTGAGQFSLNFISSQHCMEDFILEVEVEETPEIQVEIDNNEGCFPLEVNFTNISPNTGIANSWNFGNNNTSENFENTSHTYTEAGIFNWELTVEHYENCISTLAGEAPIEVYQVPQADFSYTPERPNLLNNEVEFTDNSSGNIFDWNWTFGDNEGSFFSHPRHIYQTPGVYEVNLTVTSEGNCKDSISQLLVVENAVNLFAPNAISPNYDGINDYFEIHYKGVLYNFEITILDRWGSLLFQSDDPEFRWDGRNSNKQPLSQGSYVYFISYTLLPETPTGGAQNALESGTISIVR